ncbi:MAG: hypothetical protein Roseis2KO_02050 [Roseivirga sp.]
MKTVAIVQARMGSMRLPGKVMKPVKGVPLMGTLLERLSRSLAVDEIIVATSEGDKNEPLVKYASDLGYRSFQGSESDVLDRYYQAAVMAEADVVVRITGDCPLVEPNLVDEVLAFYKSSGADIVSNAKIPTYPDGLDIAVFSFAALKKAHSQATAPDEREHVTLHLYNNDEFKKAYYKHDTDHSDKRWTVDEAEDFEVVKNVLEHFYPRNDFDWKEVIQLEEERPELFAANKHLIRNEGARLGTGQKLWKRAKSLIPGGNMLLSKRSEMFLPDGWPSYFSKAKGCEVWDMDNNHFIDMSIMGIGTNTLGYGNDEVDEAVRAVVNTGNMSTLNCPEEVYLGEKLIEMHPWADMVRYARTGGEANAIALRIARAATGKDKVAFCGYHGWHDWYLSTNLSSDDLKGHLLGGLDAKGVPAALKGTAIPFTYNDFAALQEITKDDEVGVIIMEVMRNLEPEDDFLRKVRKLADEKGIVLIFDECSSGFRQTFGGLHLQYEVEPDMAMFGKTLGNGYAINAVIGKRDIMEHAQETFISSTFWTERIGPAAAIATLKVMEETKSWEQLVVIGNKLSDIWTRLGQKHQLKMRVFGLPALLKFAIESPDMLKYKTFITQEMLKKGFLAGNSVYACTEHSDEILEAYTEAFDPVLAIISQCEHGELDINKLLEWPVCHSGFARIN